MTDVSALLKDHGIRPTAQRLAIVGWVLEHGAHVSADEVWAGVKQTLPTVSRATVYNTLNCMVDRGLLGLVSVTAGSALFDPQPRPHHHLIDEQGELHDVPLDAVSLSGVDDLPGFEVDGYTVVLRGRRRD